MIELIVGSKGKGKTKELLSRAAAAVNSAQGSIVYVDKNLQHIYELSNKIRLINFSDFPINTTDGFTGFICGLISQDRDLEYLFLDSFLHNARLKGQDVAASLELLKTLSDKYGLTIVISISLDKEEIPEAFREYITVAL